MVSTILVLIYIIKLSHGKMKILIFVTSQLPEWVQASCSYCKFSGKSFQGWETLSSYLFDW